MAIAFRGPGKVPLEFTVNGEAVQVLVEPRRTLLSVLREELGLTGSKLGCDHGQCGACTVILDGETVYACLTLAIDCEGREVRTIEGVSHGQELHPVQQAFIEYDGYQCGFCTPGQVMSAIALLEHNPHPTEEEVVEAMSGNICRCGAYPNILDAVVAAAEMMAAEEG
ncbi:MAG: (2Fe-2S)-binding protein [Anaerolineae bacterium]|nr:(2Fe-2S)-binding protein [Anaerolineae bacterium]